MFPLDEWGKNIPDVLMEKLISEIETYCAAAGMSPQRLLRAAIDSSWSTWDAWKAGASSPTMKVADRTRAYMAAHPPALPSASPADESAA